MSAKSDDLDTGTPELLGALADGVATLTLNRPEARNAFSDTLTPALRRMIKAMGARADVGALVITGANGAFCAGGDVKGMGTKKIVKRSPEETVLDLQQKQRTLTGELVGLRIPTIAALPGPAAGGGLALALACDIRIAARSAFVTTGYAKVGLSGDYGITWHLTRLVGTARARELMFTADRVDAETCARIGLVNRVVPDDELEAETMALARRIANGPREAIALMKDNLDRALTDDFLSSLDHEAELLIQAAQSPDHREAVRAFVEKRPPRFGAAAGD